MEIEEMKEKLFHIDPAKNREYSMLPADSGALFARIYEHELCFMEDVKTWYHYAGGLWCPISEEAVFDLAVSFGKVLRIYAENLDGYYRESYIKYANRWQELPFVRAVIKFAASKCLTKQSQFDTKTHLLNCANGVYDFSAQEFRKHDPLDRMTKMTAASYIPSLTDDLFESFISSITCEDKALADYFQRVFGYSLGGENEREKMVILYGKHRNGKTTLAESVKAALGSYAGSCLPNLLYNNSRFSNAGAPTEHLATLDGLRFCCMSEPDRNVDFSESMIKLLTGNDTFMARRLNEHLKPVSLHTVFYISVNSLPTITDASVFRSRRLIVLPFQRTFEPHEQDPSLKRRFREDPHYRSVILSWLITGYNNYLHYGIDDLPEPVRTATEHYYTTGGDASVRSFMQQVAIPSQDENVKTAVLYATYKEWCDQNRYAAVSSWDFNYQLDSFGYRIIRGRPKDGSCGKTTLVDGYTV